MLFFKKFCGIIIGEKLKLLFLGGENMVSDDPNGTFIREYFLLRKHIFTKFAMMCSLNEFLRGCEFDKLL